MVFVFFAGVVMAEERTVRDVPLSDLRLMLKGYPGEWRADTDRAKGVPEPAQEKPLPDDVALIDLPRTVNYDMPLVNALSQRRSRKDFSGERFSREDLGFLLWSAQGVTSTEDGISRRTAPSAGGRYPLETYVLALRMDGIDPGIYRYLPASHQLATIREEPELKARVLAACYQQAFVGEAAAVIVWAAVPERTEWKYGYLAHRMIAMEAGHACQNVYLACEAIGAGACALLSYDQAKLDALLGVDGENEFALYLAAVGKTKARGDGGHLGRARRPAEPRAPGISRLGGTLHQNLAVLGTEQGRLPRPANPNTGGTDVDVLP